MQYCFFRKQHYFVTEIVCFCRREVLLYQWGSGTPSEAILLWVRATLLWAQATLLFHEAKLLRDEDTLVRHGEAYFGGRPTPLPPGNTYFRHGNTWFRDGLNCF